MRNLNHHLKNQDSSGQFHDTAILDRFSRKAGPYVIIRTVGGFATGAHRYAYACACAHIHTLPTILLREKKEGKLKEYKGILSRIVERSTLLNSPEPSCRAFLPEDAAAALLFALLFGLWLLVKAVAAC